MKAKKTLLALTLAIVLLFGLVQTSFAATIIVNEDELSHISVTNGNLPSTAGAPYTATLVADAGFGLPDTVSATVDGASVSVTYDSSTGALSVPITADQYNSVEEIEIALSATAVAYSQRIWFEKGSESSATNMPGTEDGSTGRYFIDHPTGTSFPVPAGASASGKVFTGWLLQGTDTVYEVGDPDLVATAGGFTLIAQWENAPPVTVIFSSGVVDKDDLTSTFFPGNDSLPAGTTVNLPVLTADNYIFNGWLVTVDGTPGDIVSSFALPEGAGTVIFTAQWQKTHGLTYLPGTTATVTGMPSPATATITEDVAFNAASAPSRSGYSFMGWKASWGNKSVYPAGVSITISASDAGGDNPLTLTAQWQDNGSSSPAYYWIHSSTSAGGSISPSGWKYYDKGDDQTYSFTPNRGYAIKAVYVDGVKVNTAYSRYTFTNIRNDHEIYVEFIKISGGQDDDDNIPATGDETPIGMAIILLAVSLMVAGIATFAFKPKKNQ